MRYFLLLCIFSFSYAKVNATKDLLNYVYDLDYKKSVDFKYVEKLVSQGADIHALLDSGDNIVSFLSESWSYMAYDKSDGEHGKNIIKLVDYFLNLGVSADQRSYRGLTAIYSVLRWGSDGDSQEKLFSLLINKNPNVNITDNTGFGLLGLSLGRSRIYKKYLSRLISHGLDLEIINSNNQNIIHLAARVKLEEGEDELLTHRLLGKINKKRRVQFANMKDDFAMTPLFYAVSYGNLDLVKYLIEEFQVKVNLKDLASNTPLSLAQKYGHKDIIKYLKDNGAKDKVKDTLISCRKRNDELDLTYNTLVKIVKECRVKKIKKLLSLLPHNYLTHRTLAYATLATQGASPEYPQVITYGEDAKLLLSFNGHKKQAGFKNLDIIHFDEKTKDLCPSG